MSDSLQSHELQHAKLLCPSRSPSLLKLMSAELVMPSHHLILCRRLPSCPQSFPMSGSFPISPLFASDGQSIGASASASGLPMNIQGWFPLELTGLISLLSKGVFKNLLQHHSWKAPQFFGTQPSLWSNSRIRMWLLE